MCLSLLAEVPLDPAQAGLRILHVGAAVLAAGAAYFQLIALRPALMQLETGLHHQIREKIIARWRGVVFACILVLLVTGLINYLMYKAPEYSDHASRGLYHGLMGVKILAALGAFHAAAVLALPGPKGEKYRNKAGFWLPLLAVLFAIAIIIAATLSTFR